jgi:hypothetical protein
VLGLDRRLTPRGAITVRVVGSAVALGVGWGEPGETVGAWLLGLEQAARMRRRNVRMGAASLRDRWALPMAARLLCPLVSG